MTDKDKIDELIAQIDEEIRLNQKALAKVEDDEE
jgi:hypothetical protein